MKTTDVLSYRNLESALRRLPAPADQLHCYVRERRIREETVQKITDDGIGGKVFGVGLSRTATTSLAEALRELGYATAHWKTRGEISGLEDFYRFDAVTDTPSACRFEQLYYAFPDSRFIYTTRGLEDWTSSVREHFGCDDPRKLTSRERARRKAEGSGGAAYENLLRWMYIHQSLYARHESWAEAYRHHDRRVRSFFQDKAERILEINIIEEQDPWGKLCEFLGQPLPDRPFPHENRSSDE